MLCLSPSKRGFLNGAQVLRSMMAALGVDSNGCSGGRNQAMTSLGKNRVIHKWFTTSILCAALLAACSREADLPTGLAPSMELTENEIPLEVQELLKVQLVNFSTMPMLLMADILGVTEIEGKSLKQEGQDATTGPHGSLYTVWTDRRDKLSYTDGEDDVWGSRTHRAQSLALTSL
jgi:hypothetical protein